MEFLAVFIVLFVGVYVGFILTIKKSGKRKFIVWGLITIFIFAPFLGWLLSIVYAIKEGDGFAGVGMMIILFPLFFIVGLIILGIGIFKKA